MGRRPRLVFVGTGGTIAGTREGARGQEYRSGVLPLETVVGSVPGLAEVADIRFEELFQLDSVDLALRHQLALARRLEEIRAQGDVDGVIVTHGTDTLEDTAYLLDLVLPAGTPVVVVGSMRPADAASADGPASLLAAVRVATCPEAVGLGVLVVAGEEIHAGRDVRKQHTTRVNAFGSPHGPLGEVTGGVARFFVAPTRAHGAFDLADLPENLPVVETVLGRADLPSQLIRVMADLDVDGVIHAGPGAGNVPATVARELAALRARGVVIVRTAQVGAGTVSRNGAVADDERDWVAGGDLPPGKARVLLTLALTVTRETARIQRIFDTY